MIKKIGIVSLSSGILGENFIEHELQIGKKRLEEYGIQVVFLPNALKGMEFLDKFPNKRAKDLIDAFADDTIDMILCAIGGDDTYRLLPYLFENDILAKHIQEKIFLGFSDTTVNHFMLYRLGLKSFYGQSFLSDICELDKSMLPYSKYYFEELIMTKNIVQIKPSDNWYMERDSFGVDQMGVPRQSFSNKGFELLSGSNQFEGEILGGCLETLYTMIDDSNCAQLCRKYAIFPTLEEWKNKILLLETSEDKSIPENFKGMIQAIKQYGVFDVVSGVLVGKPQDEAYYNEYKNILLEELSDKELSIVYNVNIGHATPRCIIPLGVHARVDVIQQTITFQQ